MIPASPTVCATLSSKGLFSIALSSLIFLGSGNWFCSQAAIANWTGTGTVQDPTGGVFSEAGNWENDVLPTFDSSTALVFDLTTTLYEVSNDLGAVNLNRLLFKTSSGPAQNEFARLSEGTLHFLPDGTTAPEIRLTGGGRSVNISSNLILGANLDVVRTSRAGGTVFGIGFSGFVGGNIDLNSYTLRITRPSSTPGDVNRVFIGRSGSTASGVIQGTGKVVIEDPAYIPSFLDQGPQTLHLGSRSTYTGGTEVRQGQLAIAGETFFSNGVIESGPFGTGPVRMYQGVLRSGPVKYTLYNPVEVNGSFDFGSPGFQGISVAGNIQLNGSYTIGVAANTDEPVEVSGPITESSPGTGLTWDLRADLQLSSVASYTGPTVVKGFGLHLNAPGSLESSTLRLTTGAKLLGTGVTGQLTAESGTVVSPGNGVGVLHTKGDATLESGSRLSLEINSNQPGLGYDQWDIQGQLTLDDVDLQLVFGTFQIRGGDTFFLALNDGIDPVSGVFTKLNGSVRELDEGSEFLITKGQAPWAVFEISYTAEQGVAFQDAGNDIAIRVVPEPSSSFALLSGFASLVACRRRHRSDWGS